MLTYDLSLKGELPLYAYLYRCLRDDIACGVLAAGDRLPSKRAMAQSLGVSQITVENAYAQLVAEGYVRAKERSGYYVCSLSVPAQGVGLFTPSERTQRNAEYDAREARLEASASTDPEAARLWSRAMRSVLASEPESELFAVAPAQGTMRLREAIAAHVRRTRGMEVDPDCIVVGAGAQLLVNMLVQLLGFDLTYAVEDPGYARLTKIYQANTVRVRHISLDAEGPAMGDVVAKDIDVLHLMPSHQFPTGRVTSIARRYELLGWASSAPGRYLIEDDYDCEFRLAGRPIPPLAAMDAEGRVVYMNTFSRSLGAALRLSYMVLPQHLMERYREELGFYSSTVSSLAQVALARILEDGSYERYVARVRKRARDARDRLRDALDAQIKAGSACMEEADSGLHAVLALRSALGAEEIAQMATPELLVPVSRFAWCEQNAQQSDGLRRFVVRYDRLNLAAIEDLARIAGVVAP